MHINGYENWKWEQTVQSKHNTTLNTMNSQEDIETISSVQDKSKRQKGCRFLLTCNLPPLDLDLSLLFDPLIMNYLVGQFELAPSTGTRHCHVYVVFKKDKEFTAVKKWVKNAFTVTADIRQARGNEEQCKAYCTKLESREGAPPVEMGTFDATRGNQGKRTDLLDIGDKVLALVPLQDIAREYPTQWIKYHGGIRDLAATIKPIPPRNRPVRVVALWGNTGVGKSYRINNEPLLEDSFKVTPDPHCWDMYNDQKILVFEEWQDKDWPNKDMNSYLDPYRCPLKARYQNKNAYWEVVIILTQLDPANAYSVDKHGNPMLYTYREAWMRRLGIRTSAETPGNGIIIHVESRQQIIDFKEVCWPTVPMDVDESIADTQPAAQAAIRTSALTIRVPTVSEADEWQTRTYNQIKK